MQRRTGDGSFEPVQERYQDRYSDRYQDRNEERLQDRFQNRLHEYDLDRAPHRSDKEITLGSAGLMLLGVGLFGLCALCFGLGYAAGHRTPLDMRTTSSETADQTQGFQKSTVAKPTAGQGTAQAAANPATASGDAASASGSSDNNAVEVPVAAAETRTDGATPGGDPVVRTALTTQSASGAATPAARMESATEQSAGIMVQIASVAHAEDADVLVGALRKRGYAVSSHRDPMDGLLHVQVGPFPSRTEALAMRQRLLNDGYNAVVQ